MVKNTVDLMGRKFGKLKAIKRVEEHSQKWHCECECGKSIDVHAWELLSKHRRSCGSCSRRKENVAARDIFLTVDVPIKEVNERAMNAGITFGEYLAKEYMQLTKGRRVKNGDIKKQS